jgi:hypothetical protein
MWTNFGELLYFWDVVLDTGFHPGKWSWGTRKTLKTEFAKGL